MGLFSSNPGVAKPDKFATPTTAPRTVAFDYIIAGGGTAGCVLASRLTEDPNVSVLVVEAGHSDQGELMSKIPAGWGNLWRTPAEWGFDTTAQEGLNGRELFHPRGRMLGGCSSINAQCYQHCSPSDFDSWAAKGATGWDYEALKPYFRKAENYAPHEVYSDVDPEHRGKGGPWSTGYPNTNEITSAFVEASVNAGIPKNADWNNPTTTTGVARFQTTISANGVRASTASAYLTPEVVARDNLSILTGTVVTRLLFEGTKVVGVEVGQKSEGPRWHVSANQEVILALGSLGTPQLLIASGIGPKAELEKIKVETVKELPVGLTLKDHPLATFVWKARAGTSLQFLANPLKTLPHLAQWLYNGTGALNTNLAEAALFIRSDSIPGQESSIKAGTTNASGPTAPDLEIITAPLYYVHHAVEKPPVASDDYFTLAPVAVRPTSVGTLTLSSSNVFDKPLINPNYLSTELDRTVLLEGAKLARRLAQTEPLKSYLVESVSPKNIETLSDDELLKHIKDTCETIYHPMSTASIGSVVDPELKVYGIQGLRVCDASVFPDMPAGHPVAAVVAVAERTADIIKGKA